MALVAAYLFSPAVDIAIIKLVLLIVVIMFFVALAMAAMGMFSDPDYVPGSEDDDQH